ncbi:hypothetical protein [Azospirillum sp. B4]|uniref:hypothetical protein n=1 Tax=Azospirillum sp. B4 TaxID=95605 RepID=UPI0003495299|nr:hypothetical protein [Azospirillum sp. B4]
MDAQRIAIAQKCLDAAYDRTMDFPEIVGTLIAGGFEGYAVDYRRDTATYFLPDGDSVVLDGPASDAAVALPFDQAGVVALIRWAQANPPDYSYAGFSAKAKACGCAGYIVSFPGRRVLYYGRTAETHVEHFPR